MKVVRFPVYTEGECGVLGKHFSIAETESGYVDYGYIPEIDKVYCGGKFAPATAEGVAHVCGGQAELASIDAILERRAEERGY